MAGLGFLWSGTVCHPFHGISTEGMPLPDRRQFVIVLASAALLALGACETSVGTDGIRGGSQEQPGGGVSGRLGGQQRPVADFVLLNRLTPSMEATTAQRDASVCRGWKYDGSLLSGHLMSMQQVSAEDWGRRCYHYACSAKGVAVLAGSTYRVDVNAGGWMSLTSPDGATEYRALSHQTPEFLAACNCCE